MKDINKLVEKIKNGNKKAFDELYTMTSSELYWYCRRLCGNDGDAEDLLQSTYLKVWRKIEQYNGNNFTAWLHSIAHNLWLNMLKKEKADLLSDDEFEKIPENEMLQPDNQTEQRIRHDEIIKLIDESLNEVQRMTFLRYYYDEKSVSEIAEEMECTDNAVRLRLCKSKDKLCSKIKDKNLFSVFFPLMLKKSSQQIEFTPALSTIRKSIFKKISFSAVKVPCIAVTISTGMVIAGVTISELGLPTEHFENNDSIVVVTSESESETTETTVTTSETTENVTNSDTVETTTFSVKESEIQQTVSTYQKQAITTETVTEITESESTVDVLSSYYEDYDRFISEIVSMCEEEKISSEEVELFVLPTMSEVYVMDNPIPKTTKNITFVSNTEKCSE